MGFLVLIGLLAFALWALWLRPRKRRRSALRPVTDSMKQILREKVKFYRDLDEAQKQVFEEKVSKFLSHVTVQGIETEVGEEDRMLVAASAVIPIFAFPDWEYQNLNEVLLYPNSFSREYKIKGEDRNVAGMVGWGPMHRTMILSRQSLRQGFENEHSKSNVGIHEFVHLIDKLDGATDGLPEVLLQRQYAIPWMKMIHQEMEEIREKKSNINPYGATNEAEFFSVASEYFFTQPEMLRQREPELYEMLEKVFKQDPAAKR